MRKASFIIFTTLVLAFVSHASALAQSSNAAVAGKKCGRPIYEPKEVTRRPLLVPRDSPELTPQALAHNVRGRVVLSAVLCHTGKVTDIQIIEGLPFGVTEKVIEAARQIQFEPAERNGRRVSQLTRFEYSFSYIGDRRPPAREPIAGRMIETVEISGLRSRALQETFAPLKTRPGESYSQDLVMADLQSLLALGFFDPKETKVRVEEGSRGGINVVFEMTERRLN
jgi:TonB family protein